MQYALLPYFYVALTGSCSTLRHIRYKSSTRLGPHGTFRRDMAQRSVDEVGTVAFVECWRLARAPTCCLSSIATGLVVNIQILATARFDCCPSDRMSRVRHHCCWAQHVTTAQSSNALFVAEKRNPRRHAPSTIHTATSNNIAATCQLIGMVRRF